MRSMKNKQHPDNTRQDMYINKHTQKYNNRKQTKTVTFITSLQNTLNLQ